MSNTNDGGPAYPFGQVSEVTGQPINGYHNDGMSLRDYFAGQCDIEAYTPINTFELRYGRKPKVEELADYIAEIRYLEADAMLAQREGGGDE